MSTPQPAPPFTCAQMEPLLPLIAFIENGEIDSASSAAALEHLRGCARCQRESARYSALDQALRDRFGVSSARPHTTEEIMRHIAERRASQEPGDSPASQRPDIPRPVSPRRAHPWLSGLGAVAVVVVLLGMAALLFSGRLGLGVGSRGGPPRPTFAGTQGLFADVSMVSATEGWALAQTTKTPQGATPNTVTFYHYVNGTWTPVTLRLSASAASTLQQGGPGGFTGAISMDSASDGWALASDFNNGSVLFHFTNGHWQEASQAPNGDLAGIQALSAHSAWAFNSSQYNGQPPAIFHFDGTAWTRQSLSSVNQESRIVALQMTSESLGWALVYQNNGPYQVLQYAGNNTWNVHSTLNAGNLGDVSGLAMVSADEGWAIAERGIDGPSSVTYGKPVPQLVYHYSHGKWQSAPVSLKDGFSFLMLQKIVMRSAHDGWIIALARNQRPGITASGIEMFTVLLHYDGSTWTQAQTPDAGGDVSAITGMAFAGTSGWACGLVAALPSGQDVQDDTVSVYGSPMLWRYANGGWTLYQQK